MGDGSFEKRDAALQNGIKKYHFPIAESEIDAPKEEKEGNVEQASPPLSIEGGLVDFVVEPHAWAR